VGGGGNPVGELHARDGRRFRYFSIFALLLGPVFFLVAFLAFRGDFRPLTVPDIYPWAYFFGLPCMIVLVLVCGFYLWIARRFRPFETALFALLVPPLVFSALFAAMSKHPSQWSQFPGFYWSWVKNVGVWCLFAAAISWGLTMVAMRRGGKAALP
jgi:hypothetical protein